MRLSIKYGKGRCKGNCRGVTNKLQYMTLLETDKTEISYATLAHERWMTDAHARDAKYPRIRKEAMFNKQQLERNILDQELHHAVIFEMQNNIGWNHQWHMNRLSNRQTNKSRHSMIWRVRNDVKLRTKFANQINLVPNFSIFEFHSFIYFKNWASAPQNAKSRPTLCAIRPIRRRDVWSVWDDVDLLEKCTIRSRLVTKIDDLTRPKWRKSTNTNNILVS